MNTGIGDLLTEDYQVLYIWYYASLYDLEPRPSDCEWYIPGTLMEGESRKTLVPSSVSVARSSDTVGICSNTLPYAIRIGQEPRRRTCMLGYTPSPWLRRRSRDRIYTILKTVCFVLVLVAVYLFFAD